MHAREHSTMATYVAEEKRAEKRQKKKKLGIFACIKYSTTRKLRILVANLLLQF